MLWSAGLHGLWSDWNPPLLWFINCDKTCSTLNSLTSTLLNNSSSCFFVILIFTSVTVLALVAAKDPSSPARKSQSSLSWSLPSYLLVDDWCFKQFPILQKAFLSVLMQKEGKKEREGERERGERERDKQGLLIYEWEEFRKIERGVWRVAWYIRDGWWRMMATWERVKPNLFHVRRCVFNFFPCSYVEKLWSNGAHDEMWRLLAFRFCLQTKRKVQ